MPASLSNLEPDDPRIHTLRGECGCVIRSTTSKYPDVLAGRKVYIDCMSCQRATRVFPFERQEVTYCSNGRCTHPEVPLSRYNTDPERRCNLCQRRDQAEWLEKLRNPFGAPREQIRGFLAENGESTAVQIERGTGIDVAKVYNHLVDMAGSGEILKHRPRKQLAVYRLAENAAVAA
jgi:hypothetical protein